MPKLAMIIDLKRCTGCHSCTIACQEEHNVPLGLFRTKVSTVGPFGTFPNLKMYYLPRLCVHCEEAPCIDSCPMRAIYRREDGIVIIDSKCNGCRYCESVCPYEAIFYNPEKDVCEKCDLCYERIGQGKRPRCVDTCTAGALYFGDLADGSSEVCRILQDRHTFILMPHWETKPSLHYCAP
jgi:Fe-S-cluster-containing dehydrogenase component